MADQDGRGGHGDRGQLDERQAGGRELWSEQKASARGIKRAGVRARGEATYDGGPMGLEGAHVGGEEDVGGHGGG